MKTLFLLIVSALAASQTSQAQTVLVRHPSANKAEYQQHLSNEANALSFIDYTRLTMIGDSTQEDSLFQLADNLNQSALFTLARIEETAKKAPLTPTALRFLNDLLRRTETTANTRTEKAAVKNHLCKIRNLIKDLQLANTCPGVAVDLEAVKQRFPQAETIFLESEEVKPAHSLRILPDQNYNWTLSSNSYHSVRYYGTQAELLNQTFAFEPLVAGSCQAPNFHIETNSLGTVQAFFSTDCIGLSTEEWESSRAPSWISENKNWLIPTGLLLAGGIAFSLKDKALVLKLPF